jgi:LysM repeat protein
MRKILVISILLLSMVSIACGNGVAVPVSIDGGTEMIEAETVSFEEAPRVESTPTPPLPPTFTPSAMAHQGHLYLLPVSGADGTVQYAYKVRSGDSLTAIGAMYGVSVQEVLLVNNISDANHIEVGDLLIIPIDG